jgi:hypothetical protein
MTLKLAYEVHILVVVSPASPVLKQVRFGAGIEEVPDTLQEEAEEVLGLEPEPELRGK